MSTVKTDNTRNHFLKKALAILLSFGPYTIGTGSVTSIIIAGSTYGMQLLWVPGHKIDYSRMGFELCKVYAIHIEGYF
jgi:hypothetical protein